MTSPVGVRIVDPLQRRNSAAPSTVSCAICCMFWPTMSPTIETGPNKILDLRSEKGGRVAFEKPGSRLVGVDDPSIDIGANDGIADRLQSDAQPLFLGLKRLGRLRLLRDVTGGPGQPAATTRVGDELCLRLDMPDPAHLSDDPIAKPDDLSGRHRPLERPLDLRGFVRMEAAVPQESIMRSGADVDAEYFTHACVPVHHLGRIVIFPDRDPRGSKRKLVELVEIGKLGLGFFLSRDVGLDADHANRIAVTIPFHDAAAIQYPDPLAILVSHTKLGLYFIRLAGDMTLADRNDPIPVIGMKEFDPEIVLVRELGRIVSEHPLPSIGVYAFPSNELPVPNSETSSIERVSQARCVAL